MDQLQKYMPKVKIGTHTLRTFLSAMLMLIISTPPIAAEPWKKVADWVLVASQGLGGCTMATKLAGGVFISITAVDSGEGEQSLELLVSDNRWTDIQSEELYSVDVVLIGSNQGPRRHQMTGFSNFWFNQKISSALFANFSASTEFSSFLSRGMATSSHLALYMDGKLLGIYVLKSANAAFHELQNCYKSNSSFKV